VVTNHTIQIAMKVAKLVRVTLMTRVIVDVDATEQDIMELAVPKLSENLMDSPFDSIEEIVDDTECPYDASDEEYDTLTFAEKKVLNHATRYLIYEDEAELISMVKAIINHEDENELIDYVDGVEVWVQIELGFTCKQFCQEIDYTGNEFKN
jgi:hypothetical protein